MIPSRSRPLTWFVVVVALGMSLAACGGGTASTQISTKGQLDQGTRGQLGGLTNDTVSGGGVSNNDGGTKSCANTSDAGGNGSDTTGGEGEVSAGGSTEGGQPVSHNLGSHGYRRGTNRQHERGVGC